MKTKHSLDNLIQHAFSLGVSDAKAVPVKDISVEDHLAKMCEDQRCEGYGQTINCPPHVMKPAEFREHIKQYEFAVVFKFDVPTEILLTDDRRDVARIVHETAANIELFAVNHEYAKSKGLAAGSCKPLFCSKYDKCIALDRDGECRFPNLARPSMSGLGINFFELTKVLGWQMSKITRDSNPDNIPMGLMAGMVLVET